MEFRTKSVFQPGNPSHEHHELRFANAALLNAAIAYVANPKNRDLFEQLEGEAAQVVALRKLDPLLGGHITLSNGAADDPR